LKVLKLEQQDLPLEAIAYELEISPNEQFHGDALDLVMRTNGCNFDDAVTWLCDRFDETPVLQAVHNHAITQAVNIIRQKLLQPFVPPSSCPSYWQKFEDYLRQQYLIPSQLSQTLRKRDLIYADDAGNGVFIARNLDGESTGAYLLVAKDKKQFQMYPESRRSKGWFHLSVGGGKYLGKINYTFSRKIEIPGILFCSLFPVPCSLPKMCNLFCIST
jgi:hypothetical protein